MKIVDIRLHKNEKKQHKAIVTVLVDGERYCAEATALSPEAAIRYALLDLTNSLAEDLMNTVTVKQTAIF